MRSWIIALLLVLASDFGSPANAQDVQPGDNVRLVVRSQNIPAHLAPGDSGVPFRFMSGSLAEVLGLNAQTGWILIRGDQVGGSESMGWITQTYIANIESGDDDGDGGESPEPQISWCPPKGSPDLIHANRVRLASWNMENLHAVDGQSTYATGTNPSVKRETVDYDRMKCYVRLFDPDILAVQEVDGEAALRRVVDTDVYNILVDQRPKPSGMNGKQNTGFAYKKGLNVQVQPDFEDLDVSSGGLRYGSRMDLTIGSQTILLMSVHLKSGCFQNSDSGSDCNTLMRQVPVLETWIDQAAAGPNPFIVLGDFNRRVDQPSDNVWVELDDSQPANADLTSITADMPISCHDNQFKEFIDHIVFDKRSIAFVDRTSFRHVNYRQADKADWSKLSDHCPIMVEMWF